MRTSMIFIICLCVIFCSCEASKYGFNAPVPIKGKKLQAFGNELIGTYKLTDTSRILISKSQTISKGKSNDSYFALKNTMTITKDSFINFISGLIVINKDSLSEKDKNDLLLNQQLDTDIMNNIPNPTYFYQIDSNQSSYIINLKLKSNLFAINDSGVLIQFKGNYYLNSYESLMKQWLCCQLVPFKNKKELSINTISNDDITILKRLIISDPNSNKKEYVPSMKVFKRFLKQGGFENKISLHKN
jgi:hypothetical protein